MERKSLAPQLGESDLQVIVTIGRFILLSSFQFPLIQVLLEKHFALIFVLANKNDTNELMKDSVIFDAPLENILTGEPKS